MTTLTPPAITRRESTACGHWNGTRGTYCDHHPTVRYLPGYRCASHVPTTSPASEYPAPRKEAA